MKFKILVLAFLICLSALPAVQTMAQVDSSKPELFDLSTGSPITNSSYTIQAKITDNVEVDIVRLYVYFELSQSGVNTPEYLTVTKTGTDTYQGSVFAPINASVMCFTISASDTSDNWNITDVIKKDVVDNQNPIADYFLSASINVGLFHFDGSMCSDNIGVENYTWSFNHLGQNIILYGDNASFNFTELANYTITLTARDAAGNSDSCTSDFNIGDKVYPVSNPGVDLFVVVEEVVILDGSSSTDNVGIVNYTWSLTYNDTYTKIYGVNPEIIFWETGTYNITLRVFDASGNWNTDTFMVTVLNDGSGGNDVSWWSIVLAIMIVTVFAVSIYLLKTSKD